jgi:hypothetical protein
VSKKVLSLGVFGHKLEHAWRPTKIWPGNK